MAIEKLKRELKENPSDKVPGAQITDYLIQRCQDDEDFSEKVLDENKNLKGCFDFVYKKVKEKLESKSGWIDDQEVYNMAEEYFTGEKAKKVKVIKKSEELSKADEAASHKIKEASHKIKEIEAEKNKEIDEKDKKIRELEERIKSIQESNKQESLEKSNKEIKKKVSKDKKKDKTIEGQMSFL